MMLLQVYQKYATTHNTLKVVPRCCMDTSSCSEHLRIKKERTHRQMRPFVLSADIEVEMGISNCKCKVLHINVQDPGRCVWKYPKFNMYQTAEIVNLNQDAQERSFYGREKKPKTSPSRRLHLSYVASYARRRSTLGQRLWPEGLANSGLQ